MHPADIAAQDCLDRLRTHFNIPHRERTPILAAPNVLIGTEVEVPWRAYFPELWSRYFKAGARSFKELSESERDALSAECSAIEQDLIPRLQATADCGLPRGIDRYWEFAFPPVNDLSLLTALTQTLIEAGLMPWGRYSLQATISGVRQDKHLYYALLLLELLYGRKERILQAFKGHGAWARKGKGGIYEKPASRLLFGSESALELRTLELPESFEQFEEFMQTLASLTHLLTSEEQAERRVVLSKRLSELIEVNGLPSGMWDSPVYVPSLWERYAERFDDMSEVAHVIAREELFLVK